LSNYVDAFQEMAMTQDKEETKLITAAKKGDRRAFDALISRYKGFVNSLVFSHVKRPEETKDIAQEVFLRAFRFIDELDDRQKFSSWLAQIAKALSLNWISRHKSMTSLESIDLEDPKLLHRQAALRRHTPHDKAVNTEVRQTVLSAVDSLQEHYKVVLLLKYMEELSYEEIAEMLGVSVATIRSRLYRAKHKLHRVLRARAVQIEKYLAEQREGLTPNMADVDIDYFAEDVDLETLLGAL